MCSKITFLSSSSQVLTDVHDDVIVPAGTMESIPFPLKQEFSPVSGLPVLASSSRSYVFLALLYFPNPREWYCIDSESGFFHSSKRTGSSGMLWVSW